MTDESEISKAARDAFVHGTGFMRDGKHVPVEDVYMTAKEAAADDLVKRLHIASHRYVNNEYNLYARAAARIEQLEAALREIAAGYETEWSTSSVTNMLDIAQILSERIFIARAALREKKE